MDSGKGVDRTATGLSAARRSTPRRKEPESSTGAHDDAALARVTYLPGVQPHDQSSEEDAGGTAEDSATEKGSARSAKRAANVSMSALTRRGHSRWELERTLSARELESDEITAELDRLESVGLIDDAALAETLVRTQHERKGLGRSALVAELRRRHIDQEHIDSALEQIDGDSELARARELATRRAPQLESLDHATANRRLSAFLMRKGYSSSIVRTAVDDALGSRRSTVWFR